MPNIRAPRIDPAELATPPVGLYWLFFDESNGDLLSVKDSSGAVSVITAALADGDYGDFTVVSGTATLDSGVVSTTKLGGDITTAGKALLDDASASDQRTTLGLGTIATQAANNVTITGGSITGITDLAVADGGTGASNASGARTNLGATTVGGNVFTLTNPSAVTYIKIAADNTVTAVAASTVATDAQGDGSSETAAGFRGVPQNAQSGNYTLVLADAGKHIYHASGDGSGDTYTIPANGSVPFPVGTAVTFVNLDSNSVSIAITTDTMYLAGTGSTGSRTLAQYGVATAVKVASTLWLISGTGLT